MTRRLPLLALPLLLAACATPPQSQPPQTLYHYQLGEGMDDRPLSFADRVRFAVSPPNACALKDGTFWAIAWMRSGWPTRSRTLESSTVTGAAGSIAFRKSARSSASAGLRATGGDLPGEAGVVTVFEEDATGQRQLLPVGPRIIRQAALHLRQRLLDELLFG